MDQNEDKGSLSPTRMVSKDFDLDEPDMKGIDEEDLS